MESKTLIINTARLHIQIFKRPAQVGITIIFNFFLFIFPQNSEAQNDGFSKVLDQDDRISGTFGEIRSNHFHSGTDYKTNEKEGFPVCAAADGYVARVKVSSVGYGKVLYINHLDGTTTVYGHLRAFYPAIADSVKNLQFAKQEFEQEFFPDSTMFPVKSGQLIGFSGNSGGSEGPHLHFETRNTKTEKPFPPQYKGYLFPDTIPPLIQSVAVYIPGPFRGLYGSSKIIFPVNGRKELVEMDTLMAESEFFIGFEAHDLAGVEPNRLGIHAYRIYLRDSLVYSCKIEEFAFDETRLVNASIDYPFKEDSGRTILICTRLPGNELNFFGPGNGLMELIDGKENVLRIEADDLAGNTAKMNFIIQKSDEPLNHYSEIAGTDFTFGKSQTIKQDHIQIKLPEKAFYENVRVNLSKTNQIAHQSYSPVYAIQPANLPVNKPVEISIQPIEIAKDLESKLLIAKVDSSGGLRSMGGKFANGWVTSSIRSLGNFTVAIDTSGPVASKPYLKPDDLTSTNQLIIPVKDNLSGLAKYSCLINDQWVCGEYNATRSEIAIYFDQFPVQNSKFTLKIMLTDQKANLSEWVFEIEK